MAEIAARRRNDSEMPGLLCHALKYAGYKLKRICKDFPC